MSDRLDAGERIPVMPQWYRVENKWRAARYGLDAIIILDKAGNEQLVTEHLTELLNELEPVSKRLGCENELRDVERIMRGGAGYQWQRKIAAENNGDLCAVVRDNTARMRLT